MYLTIGAYFGADGTLCKVPSVVAHISLCLAILVIGLELYGDVVASVYITTVPNLSTFF